MLEFQQPPKEYSHVFLEDTDSPLPAKIDPNTRYAFFSTLARGGKSLIKSCKDLHLSRVVCYKTLRPECAGDPLEQQRLLREARISAMLQHPNTVPTYEVGRDRRGNYYFTMKLVHGYTLREVMNYRARYDLTQLVDIIVQIAQALAYAHAHGVAHRDIKPENILVGPFGEVLLLDWGLAKVWGRDGSDSAAGIDTEEAGAGSLPAAGADPSQTQRGPLQGTLCYMSPEQIARDPAIGYGTDTYSLGAVLYELLAGQTPFTADKTYELLDRVANQPPQAPSKVSQYRVPATLETLAMQCLAKDPAARPASMGEVLKVLQNDDWHAELRG
ncbi:MAG: serine/threonine protein kinase [Cellvibrionales bacterium]|nr:serine/threonine protein kinase [Cellvibrionales bacterium]